jgi:hypothetical protein
MIKGANVDLIFNGQGQGEVANYALNQSSFNVGAMRPFIGKDGRTWVSLYKGGDPKQMSNYNVFPIQANATLRRDEWKQLDDTLMETSKYRLGGVEDLIGNGLTYNLGNAMGTTVLEWHDIGDFGEATITMDGVTRGDNDRPNFQFNYLPIPIVHFDYEINQRALEASRKLGNPLDTTSAANAGRKVAEKLENMLFTDSTYSFGEKDDRNNNTIYSYLNHPDINLVTLAEHWDASASTGALIVEDVRKMKQASIDDYHYGPWMLYIPTNYETIIDMDYDKTTPGTTTRERIMKIDRIKGIKVIDTLPADKVLLVQMTPDVVRLIRGLGLTNVEWKTEGGFISNFKVLTIQVPQIRSDQNKRSGIVLLG